MSRLHGECMGRKGLGRMIRMHHFLPIVHTHNEFEIQKEKKKHERKSTFVTFVFTVVTLSNSFVI